MMVKPRILSIERQNEVLAHAPASAAYAPASIRAQAKHVTIAHGSAAYEAKVLAALEKEAKRLRNLLNKPTGWRKIFNCTSHKPYAMHFIDDVERDFRANLAQDIGHDAAQRAKITGDQMLQLTLYKSHGRYDGYLLVGLVREWVVSKA